MVNRIGSNVYVSAYYSRIPASEQLEAIAKRQDTTVEILVEDAKKAIAPSPTQQRIINLARRMEREQNNV